MNKLYENSPACRFGLEALLAVLVPLICVFAGPGAFGQTAAKFAVIGDYGSGDVNERSVADLVKSWNPDFIITLGDNNYPDGEASTIDRNIGFYFHSFIHPYSGIYGSGASVNRFFPSLGNHDLDNATGVPGQPYFDYFTLPNNERYYDFVRGPVHFFVLNSDPREPDGNTADSAQAEWLRGRLAASTAQWKIVYFHHTPYSSRGGTAEMRWPFQTWGATAVLAGHAHNYERVMKNGFPYFTNGLGGATRRPFGTPVEGSVVRYDADHGAQLVTADAQSITFSFITRTGTVIDSYTIGTTPLGVPGDLTASAVSNTAINLAWTDSSSAEEGHRIERCQNADCTNFSEIAVVGANVTTFTDGGLSPGTIYRYRARSYNAGGASGYSNVSQATTGSAGSALLSDDFNDGQRDPSRWDVGIFSRSVLGFNPQIAVTEPDGRLSIAPQASVAGSSYSGYASVATWNFVGGAVSVEAVQKASGNAATILSAGTDKDNWYGIRAKGSTIYFESRRLGVTTSATVSYGAVDHRFWRIRHDPQADTVVYETGPDGLNWTARRTIARQIDLSALRFELIAGTGEAVASPGAALFDNFRLDSTVSAEPPPNAPGSLSADAVSAARVELSWTDNSTNESGFKIERCRDAGCSDFAQIAQVAAGAAVFADTGVTAGVTYRYRVRAFNAVGDSAYSNTAEVTLPPAPGADLADDFNDNARDPAKWSIGILSRSAASVDPLVEVAERDGRLSIAPRASVAEASYNGYLSTGQWSLEDRRATVELVQKASGSAATIFSVGIDKDNWFGFRAKGSTLYLETRVNAVTQSVAIAFDAVQHRFWRLRHDPAADAVRFETSADGQNWTVRRTAARTIDLGTVRIELIAGTSGAIAAPGTAIFDDLALAANDAP